MVKITTYEEVNTLISVIKRQRRGFITNFYISPSRLNFLASKEAVYLIRGEEEENHFLLIESIKFSHLFFFSTDVIALENGLKNLRTDTTFVVDLIGDNTTTTLLANAFLRSGFSAYKRLYRMSRLQDVGEHLKCDDQVVYANQNDTRQVFCLLQDFFDPYSEQIPLLDELQEMARQNRILVLKQINKIVGFAIFEINGMTSYLRYWFTHPDFRDRKVGSVLLRRFFYECRNTKRQLFWVIDDNHNAIKRYEHYGFTQETMIDNILIRTVS